MNKDIKINDKREYYNSIDGLRVIACFGIIIMHIRANTVYNISGWFWNTAIPSWTWFVYLFLMISGFSICAGYLIRFNNNNINIESFYKKRYTRILPFFTFLVIIAVLMEHSLEAFYEGTIEVTLLFGLLPNNNLNVLGVCWTLGVIFLFYLLFPFFSVLLNNKKRAWISLAISLWINYLCTAYFFGEDFVTKSFVPRHSFIYCIPLFIGGGIVYLYRNEIRKVCEKFRVRLFICCVIGTVIWYIIPDSVSKFDFFFLKTIIIFMMWLSYAVGVDSKFLSNKVMKYFSSISMEMYLAHMIIFRVIEKVNLLYVFGNTNIGGLFSAIFVFILDVIGLIIFIGCYKFTVKFVSKKLNLESKKFL